MACAAKELGVAAYLIKPVLQSDLPQALLRVLVSQDGTAKPAQMITRHSLRKDACRCRSFLPTFMRCWDQVLARLPGAIVMLSIHAATDRPALLYSRRSFGQDMAGVAESLGLIGRWASSIPWAGIR
jgi:hypothetical protein